MRAALRKAGLVLAAVSLLACGVLALLWARTGAAFSSQDAARRWQGNGPRLAQVSAFFSEQAAFDADGVMALRAAVDGVLSGLSLESGDQEGPAWTDCYSGVTAVAAAVGENVQQARAVCTGGEFFIFHPLDMAGGWYYTGQDGTDDLVVLDARLAWQLFGSVEVTGLTVEIEGWPCTVAGVAYAPDQRDEAAAYGQEGTLYMSASLLSRLGIEPPVTCYEALLPEAVRGFAAQTLTSALTLPEDSFLIQQNTGRFSFSHGLALARDLPAQVQRADQVYFPWWENAARAGESRAALLAAAAAGAAVWPALWGLFQAIGLLRRGLARLRARREDDL